MVLMLWYPELKGNKEGPSQHKLDLVSIDGHKLDLIERWWNLIERYGSPCKPQRETDIALPLERLGAKN